MANAKESVPTAAEKAKPETATAAATKEAPAQAAEAAATKEAPAQAAEAEPHLVGAWEEVGNPDVEAWWKPEIGLVITGQIVGRMKLQQDGAKRDVILVKITEPCMAQAPGSQTSTSFPAGSIIGVGVRHKLRGLLLYVKHKGMIWVKATGKTKLKGSQTMWNFDVKAKGKRAQPEPINVNVDRIDGDDSEEDDLPF